jgi:acetyltransferase
VTRPVARGIDLPKGERVTLRAMEPSDASRVVAFIAALSPTSGYRRALRPLRNVPPTVIDRLTRVDFDRDVAFIALHRGDDGRDEMVGGARYVRDTEGTAPSSRSPSRTPGSATAWAAACSTR